MVAHRAGLTARATVVRASGKGNGSEGQRQETVASMSNGMAMVLHVCMQSSSLSSAGYTSHDGDAHVS